MHFGLALFWYALVGSLSLHFGYNFLSFLMLIASSFEANLAKLANVSLLRLTAGKQGSEVPTTQSNKLQGIARHLPGISWSTIASLLLPHPHPPADANVVTLGGDWPLATFNDFARF